MDAGGPESVRLTKRCLSDLGLDFPRLTVPLHSLDHPLVRHAQGLPQKCALNAAERVVAITDRVWWKRKTGQQRGMGGKFPSFSADRSWWIGLPSLRAVYTAPEPSPALLTSQALRGLAFIEGTATINSKLKVHSG